MSTKFEDILYDVSSKGVARLTINRESSYNAYTTKTLQEIREAVRKAAFDPGVYMLVVTGTGRKAFCTGGDVKEYADHYVQHPQDFWQYMVHFQDCLDAIRHLGKPTIARLNGMTVGGGNEFNMACDLAVMAEHAFIRQVGTRVGSVAAGG
ncbi:MAG: enoyl-CoA hydratase/isomerase family protein, partial [Firmicutes bacterium]|nr:enoyl-CoA hydratase/isomerase family protein [Bacillota bacterium]